MNLSIVVCPLLVLFVCTCFGMDYVHLLPFHSIIFSFKLLPLPVAVLC